MEPASWQTTLETVCSNLCQIFFYFGKQIPKVFKGYQDLPGGSSGKEPACQCRRRETQVQSLGWEDPLEKGMATHSSILAWGLPRTKEPKWLQSMGLQKSQT